MLSHLTDDKCIIQNTTKKHLNLIRHKAAFDEQQNNNVQIRRSQNTRQRLDKVNGTSCGCDQPLKCPHGCGRQQVCGGQCSTQSTGNKSSQL